MTKLLHYLLLLLAWMSNIKSYVYLIINFIILCLSCTHDCFVVHTYADGPTQLAMQAASTVATNQEQRCKSIIYFTEVGIKHAYTVSNKILVF